MPKVDAPTITRSPDRLLGGVCAGIAEHFGVDPLLVRLGAVLLALVPVAGILAYGAAWWFLPLDPRPATAPAAERPGWLRAIQRDEPRTIVGATCLGLGASALVQSFDVLGGDSTVLAISLIATGIAVAWVRTAPEERDRLRGVVSRAGGSPAALLTTGPGSLWRLIGGIVLVVLGLLALAGGSGQLDDLGAVLLAAVVTAGGIGLLVGPWALGILRVAGDERRQRIRTEERAELAAQLHDSVLQTLVLIQRSAPSRPTEAVALARRQERELRSWLYGDGAAQPDGPETLAAALEVMAADVEAGHGVEVELVTVGDRPLEDATVALVAAAREALVNAAKHAGVASVDCYAETDAATTRVFVRDRGAGFDPATVAADRRGITESITGRLDRVGGTAAIASVPGDGTEVTLELPAVIGATTKVRTFLVDDHRLFLTGVRTEIEGEVDIVGTALDVAGAIAGILETGPEVVLLDVHLPDGGGRAVLEGVLPQRPDIRFLALSVSDAAEDVIGVIRAGARGYVTKTIGPEDLVDAIGRVRDGDAVFSPRLAGFVLDAFASAPSTGPAPPEDVDELTPREVEVLRLIARGYTYRELAQRLEISVKTVESHVSAVLRKLQLSTRHQLARWATDRGLQQALQ